MKKKVALVTGASSEIGKTILKTLRKENFIVIAQYNANEIGLHEKEIIPIQCSFENPHDIQAFIIKVLNLELKINYLVNSAGIIENNQFLITNLESIKRIFEINFFSHITLMQKFFPLMCNNHFGRIVSLSSIGVKFFGSENSVFYSASKAALEAVTLSFAKFGAENNVLCNNIRVGVIDTKIHGKKNLSERTNKIPVKRLGNSEDIANMVAYLFSEKGQFITGQNIAVSGGE